MRKYLFRQLHIYNDVFSKDTSMYGQEEPEVELLSLQLMDNWFTNKPTIIAAPYRHNTNW